MSGSAVVKVLLGAILLAVLVYASFTAEEEVETQTVPTRKSTAPARNRNYRVTADGKRRLREREGAPGAAYANSLRRRGREDWQEAADLRGCCVCRDAAVEMLFEECGHVCMCELCVVQACGGQEADEEEDVVLRCPQCRLSGKLRRVYCS